MKESIKSIAEWSEQTFPKATFSGQLSKFKDEKKEYLASMHILDNGLITGDITEMADMFIVAASLSRFSSIEAMYCFGIVERALDNSMFTTQELEDAVDKKMQRNRAREWAVKDGKYQHTNKE